MYAMVGTRKLETLLTIVLGDAHWIGDEIVELSLIRKEFAADAGVCCVCSRPVFRDMLLSEMGTVVIFFNL